ncbi:transcriptional antiterminator RfaH [uncultured Thiomicrorhabdus sp.]
MGSWYLLMSKAKQDQEAERNLRQQGYEVYRPTIQVFKKRRGKTVPIEESLFPRYLFISLCEQTQDWGPIRSTRGVLQLVRFGGKPARVDQTLIDVLQQREIAMQQSSESEYFKKGDLVRIESGPFYGLEAVFENYDADERVIALMNILGKQQKVALSQADVEKI